MAISKIRSKPNISERYAIIFERVGPYHHARLKALSKKIDITCIEIAKRDVTYSWDLLENQSDYKKITILDTLGNKNLNDIDFEKSIFSILNEIKPLGVAIPGWYEKYSLMALSWCLENNIPAILMSDSTKWFTRRWWFIEKIKSFVLKGYNAALVAGTPQKEYLENLGYPPDLIKLGYDVVDNQYFYKGAQAARKRESTLRKKLHLPDRYIMFCGRFIPVKNLPKILEGYAEYCRAVPDALDLIMVGDGPSKNELVELTLKLGVKEKVFFNGFVQYEQLPQYYGLADLFILGSYMEQWGLVVNEAMASGLPVLVSNKCGCVNDLVRNNENGFVFNPNNPEELAICLKEITAHPLKLKNMGKDSLKIIKDWDITKFSLSFCECVDLANNKFTNRPMFLFKLFIRLLSRRFFGAANKI